MTKYFNIAAMAAVLLLASCAGNNGPEVDKSIMPAAADTVQTINASSSQAVDAQSTQTIQAIPDPSATGSKTIAVPAPTPAPSAGAGLNPAHGQPGHRCDIAVGAPLNSSPAVKTTGTPAVTSTPVATPVAAPTTTAPGMNPPHGQPGHDCSIAVGAPLKKG